jgi:hypothetical protein
LDALRSKTQPPNGNEKENEMRKFLIAALGLASIASGDLIEAAGAVTTVDIKSSDLEAYCKRKDGLYTETKDTTTCAIGSGKSAVVIGCSKGGTCTMDHTMVFSSKPSTHGPVGQASDTTLRNGGKKPAAGNTLGAGSTTVGGGSSGNATPTGIKPPANSASTTVGANGGGPNGRPALQRQ